MTAFHLVEILFDAERRRGPTKRLVAGSSRTSVEADSPTGSRRKEMKTGTEGRGEGGGAVLTVGGGISSVDGVSGVGG